MRRTDSTPGTRARCAVRQASGRPVGSALEECAKWDVCANSERSVRGHDRFRRHDDAAYLRCREAPRGIGVDRHTLDAAPRPPRSRALPSPNATTAKTLAATTSRMIRLRVTSGSRAFRYNATAATRVGAEVGTGKFGPIMRSPIRQLCT